MNTLTANYYIGVAKPGRIPVLAIAFSAAFHLALLTGFNRPGIKLPVHVHPRVQSPPESIEVPVPEDPPLAKPEDLEKPAVTKVAAPMQQEVIVINPLDRLTQEAVKIPPITDMVPRLSIPTNIGTPLDGREVGRPFNPDELDKKPEAISQISPTFPYDMQREVSEATVRVGFIVDRHGNVADAHIISCSHRGFEHAALSAIEKWKFRPGVKNLQKVSTRVEQLLAFVTQNDR